MEIVLPRGAGFKAPLQPPSRHGYLILAAKIDRRPPFLPRSRAKRALIKALSRSLADLAQVDAMISADLFVARLIAPGEGDRLLRRRGISPARFDVVILIQTHDPIGAADLRAHPAYQQLRTELDGAAADVYEVAAHNVRRIADVEHTRSSVYLFNYFYADDAARLIPVWEYTAGMVRGKHRAVGLRSAGALSRRAHRLRNHQSRQLAKLAHVLTETDLRAVISTVRARHVRSERGCSATDPVSARSHHSCTVAPEVGLVSWSVMTFVTGRRHRFGWDRGGRDDNAWDYPSSVDWWCGRFRSRGQRCRSS